MRDASWAGSLPQPSIPHILDPGMQIPLQITFRDMEPAATMEADIREKTGKLEWFYDQIMSCRVMLAAPHGHHHKGNLYQVHIDLIVTVTLMGKHHVVG